MITSQFALETQARDLIEGRIHPAFHVLPAELRRRHRKARGLRSGRLT
jgi:hypothetical protein